MTVNFIRIYVNRIRMNVKKDRMRVNLIRILVKKARKNVNLESKKVNQIGKNVNVERKRVNFIIVSDNPNILTDKKDPLRNNHLQAHFAGAKRQQHLQKELVPKTKLQQHQTFNTPPIPTPTKTLKVAHS